VFKRAVAERDQPEDTLFAFFDFVSHNFKVRKKRKILALRLWLVVVAIACFYAAFYCFDTGIRYALEVSSNPHPSEAAKTLGPQRMGYMRVFFIAGLASAVGLGVTFLIKTDKE
jgi:hypothetical protein